MNKHKKRKSNRVIALIACLVLVSMLFTSCGFKSDYLDNLRDKIDDVFHDDTEASDDTNNIPSTGDTPGTAGGTDTGSGNGSGNKPTITNQTTSFDGDKTGVLTFTVGETETTGKFGFLFVTSVVNVTYNVFYQIDERVESLGVTPCKYDTGKYSSTVYVDYGADSKTPYGTYLSATKSEFYNNSNGMIFVSSSKVGVVYIEMFDFVLTGDMSQAKLCEEFGKYVKYFTVTTGNASEIENNPTYNVPADGGNDSGSGDNTGNTNPDTGDSGSGEGGGEAEGCTHELGEYTYVNESLHSITCKVCSENLGTEAHSYTNNVCNKCGYDNTPDEPYQCTHELGEYTYVSESLHSVTCKVCGENLGTEGHIYKDGDNVCIGCGFDNTPECTHDTCSYRYKSDTVHLIQCTECLMFLGEEGHNYIDYICTRCGHDITPEEPELYINSSGYGYYTENGTTTFFETLSVPADDYEWMVSYGDPDFYHVQYCYWNVVDYSTFVPNVRFSYDGRVWNDLSPVWNDNPAWDDLAAEYGGYCGEGATLSVDYDTIYVSYTTVSNCTNPLETLDELVSHDVFGFAWLTYDQDTSGGIG